MKRFLAIIVGMLFVLGFAASAFAVMAEIPAGTQAVVAKGDTQIKLGGSLRFRGYVEETDFDTDTSPKSAYDARVRLKLTAKVSKAVKGVIELESTNSKDSDTSENWTWGDTSGATGLYKEGNARRHSLRVRQAWLQYDPGTVGIKVGHMPLALGNKIFFNHKKFGDDAIVLFADPNKNTHVAGLLIKFREGSSGKSDDADAYVVLAKYKTKTLKLGGDVTYVDDQPQAVHLWNIGLRADAKLAGVTLRGDVELQTGQQEDADVDFTGYAVVLGADFKLGKAKLTLEGGIGSGDDDATDDKEETFQTTLGAHPNAPMYTFIYDYRVNSAAGTKRAGIANTTYARLAASGKATKKIGLKGQIIWLKATEDVSLRGGDLDDNLGFEVDGKVTYKLAKNLKYYVEGGYLFAGDAYNDASGDADDAWMVRHGIVLKF